MRAFFLAAIPFAKLALTPVWAFIPIYESALVFNDLITAILLAIGANVRAAEKPVTLKEAFKYSSRLARPSTAA